jgi:hypothetical protein
MRGLIGASLAVGLGAFFAVGCSSTTSSTGTTGGSTGTAVTAGTTGTGATGGTTTAGTTGAGSTGGTSGSTTTGSSTGTAYTGFVIFGEEIIGTTKEYNGQAGFYPTVAPITCSSGTMVGECCYLSAAAALDAGAGIPPDDISAGVVTLQDGTTTLAVLPFDAGVGYTSASSVLDSSFTWAAGDTLGVTASGDSSGVTGFTGTVVAPARLGNVNPAISSLSTIMRASDFVLTWTATGTSTVVFNILAANTTTFMSDGLIRCSTSSGTGTLTVSSTLLGNFQSGDGASVLLSVGNDTVISATDATVGLTAETIVVPSAGGVTIE